MIKIHQALENDLPAEHWDRVDNSIFVAHLIELESQTEVDLSPNR